MKKFTCSFLLLLPFLCLSQQMGDITVRLNNLLSDKGNIIVSLHTRETFMKTEGLQKQLVSDIGDDVTITLEKVKPGDYAITVLHDINGNGKMDFDLYGRPEEPYATSGPVTLGGPPRYEEIKFNHDGTRMEMNLRF